MKFSSPLHPSETFPSPTTGHGDARSHFNLNTHLSHRHFADCDSLLLRAALLRKLITAVAFYWVNDTFSFTRWRLHVSWRDWSQFRDRPFTRTSVKALLALRPSELIPFNRGKNNWRVVMKVRGWVRFCHFVGLQVSQKLYEFSWISIAPPFNQLHVLPLISLKPLCNWNFSYFLFFPPGQIHRRVGEQSWFQSDLLLSFNHRQ